MARVSPWMVWTARSARRSCVCGVVNDSSQGQSGVSRRWTKTASWSLRIVPILWPPNESSLAKIASAALRVGACLEPSRSTKTYPVVSSTPSSSLCDVGNGRMSA